MKEYYNTTNIVNDELTKKVKKCKAQKELVYEIFKTNPDKELTPFDVWHTYMRVTDTYNVPVTSIRRAITNLTYESKLIKTNNQRVGGYNDKNYTWKLNTTYRQLDIWYYE